MSAEIINLADRREQPSASDWQTEASARIQQLLINALADFVRGNVRGACRASTEASNGCSDLLIGRGPEEKARARAATERRRQAAYRAQETKRRKKAARLLKD
jgi:hypothetical protein